MFFPYPFLFPFSYLASFYIKAYFIRSEGITKASPSAFLLTCETNLSASTPSTEIEISPDFQPAVSTRHCCRFTQSFSSSDSLLPEYKVKLICGIAFSFSLHLFPVSAYAGSKGFFIDSLCGNQILHADAYGFKYDDLFLSLSSFDLAGQHLSQLSSKVCFGDASII